MNLKAGIYVRVSTEEQRDYGYSIDGQLRELKDYCKKQNYVIVDIYSMYLNGMSSADIMDQLKTDNRYTDHFSIRPHTIINIIKNPIYKGNLIWGRSVRKKDEVVYIENHHIPLVSKEIWEKAVNKVAKRYNLSDNGLRKICKKLEIPLPNRSYWGKFHFGKSKPKRKPLPKYNGNDYYVVHTTDFIKKQDDRNYEEYLYRFNSEERTKIILICSLIDSNIVINKYHHIINQIKEKHRKQDIYNKKTRYNLDKTETNPEVRKRIYLILHLIFTNLEKLGYKVDYSDGLQAIILGEKINFRIREKNNVVYVDDNSDFALTYGNGKRRELEPNGLLELSIIRHYDNDNRVWISPKKEVWTDSKTKKLEDFIGDFIIELIYCACKKVDDKKQRIEEEIKQRVEEEIRQAKKEIQNRKLEKLKNLETNAKNYERAKQIRQYIQVFSKKENLSEEDIQYIKWANDKADWLDPIIKREDPILDEKI